jgi:hypothetical protein
MSSSNHSNYKNKHNNYKGNVNKNYDNVKKHQHQHRDKNHQSQNQHQQAQKANYDYNILIELKDYMLDNKNIILFTKNIIGTNTIEKNGYKPKIHNIANMGNVNKTLSKPVKLQRDIHYKPRQKDSLFWCFYILKHGLSKYEMEIGNQHFVVEKQEKFKYIEMIRNSKDILKIHKIKPLTFLEDDLANNEIISIKTFFALCILEKINIILIDKRKIYETIITDDTNVNVVHRNGETKEHYIEMDIKNETIQTYRDTYYKMSNFDDGLKSMSSYKVDELMELCKKLNVDLVKITGNPDNTRKKLTKKDIYEQLVLHF